MTTDTTSPTTTTAPPDGPAAVAELAYTWGYALVLAARVRQNLTSPADPHVTRPPSVPGAPLNDIGHQRRLADPHLRVGVGPNVDTLYSMAWLDLDEDQFVFEAPDFGDRYYTFQIAFADSASDASLGQRTHGAQLPPLFVHGPGYDGPVPEGMLAVASPTRYLLLGGRVLVQPDDPDDFSAVQALQRAMRLRTWRRFCAGADGPNPVPEQRLLVDPASTVPEELRFLEELGNVLRDWVVAPQDVPLVRSFATIGLTPEHGFAPHTVGRAVLDEAARGLAEGADRVLQRSHHLGENVNGWTVNHLGPRFGADHLLRSGVAKDQIFVVVPEEALYPVTTVDADGDQLDGAKRYRLRFGPGQEPPVDAFWSLTMYHQTGGLVENPIDRYAVGDRTRGLVVDDDGSLTILVQHERPTDPSANWLPAPSGEFHVELRLYVPRVDALDGTWTPPPIECLDR
jgi:hypothetical protein